MGLIDWWGRDRVVRVEVPGLTELAEAIRYAARKDAESRRYAARVAAGIVHAKPRPERPDADEWTAWRNGPAVELGLSEPEIDHLRHAYLVLSGRERASREETVTLGMLYANAAARYGLPDLPSDHTPAR